MPKPRQFMYGDRRQDRRLGPSKCQGRERVHGDSHGQPCDAALTLTSDHAAGGTVAVVDREPISSVDSDAGVGRLYCQRCSKTDRRGIEGERRKIRRPDELEKRVTAVCALADTLEEHDYGRRAADRAVVERLVQLEAGLASALGTGLIVKAEDINGRLRALEELMVPIDEKGVVGMALANADRLGKLEEWRARWGVEQPNPARTVAELASVVLEHTKQLAAPEGEDDTLVYRVQKLEEYQVTRLNPMLNERGATADRLQEFEVRLQELEEYHSTRLTPMLNARGRRADKLERRTEELAEIVLDGTSRRTDKLERRIEDLELRRTHVRRGGALCRRVEEHEERLAELEAHRALYDAADSDLVRTTPADALRELSRRIRTEDGECDACGSVSVRPEQTELQAHADSCPVRSLAEAIDVDCR